VLGRRAALCDVEDHTLGTDVKRFDRPPFSKADLDNKVGDEARNNLIFDWWCDEDDRKAFIASLNGVPTPIRSRSPIQDDPAPPLDKPAEQGFRNVYLISDPVHVHMALTRPDLFSNVPYAMLGGGTFLLAQDSPAPGEDRVDWHAAQRTFIEQALSYDEGTLRAWAQRAVEQAELTSLARPDFDLALFAEQAALRYLGQLYGYAFQDHVLLEEAARATYRALQYVTIGQHFVTEPLTVPTAQQGLGRLVTRTSDLMRDYADLARSPRSFSSPSGTEWPTGVQPWHELIPQHGVKRQPPVLKRLAGLESNLSGRDRAAVAATMLAGTVGNIQSAVCLLTQALMELKAERGEQERKRICDADVADLEKEFGEWVSRLPPMTVVPRRTRKAEKVPLGGINIPAETDCLLILQAPRFCPHDSKDDPCPHAWGAVHDGHAAHACLGRRISQPLIAALVQRVLRLPGLKPALDALTRETLKVERLWGFACTRYPLRFQRERVRAQQNLIVPMHVKSPISENAPRLRRLIAAAVPRVDYVLANFGHLHFAWFEFSDDDSVLVLRTIYDGDFDAYIQHFALRAGDIFDGLFEFLEGAPPRPVAEHPREFVEAIRRFNRAPFAGYLFSAYPGAETDQIRGAVGVKHSLHVWDACDELRRKDALGDTA
jgi:hypothetical protein